MFRSARPRRCRRSISAIAAEKDATRQDRARAGPGRDRPAAGATPPRRTAWRRSACLRSAATRMRWRFCPPCRRRAGGRRGRRVAAAAHPLAPGSLERAAERLVRHLPRLRAAARRHRPRHHVRRDGRHQHGAWRDGDDRRLHDLRGAGAHPHLRAGAVRRLALHRAAARLPGRGRDRRPDRAHRDPLPLRPPARDAARHLGHLADPAAGGAHRSSGRRTGRSARRPG